MNKEREALKMALEALEQFKYQIYEELYHNELLGICEKTITAIKEALAQTEQEPVAWVCEASSSDEKHTIDYWPGDVDDLPIGTKLYTTPPQRTWVELTDDEWQELADKYDLIIWSKFRREIEARLKEKNNA